MQTGPGMQSMHGRSSSQASMLGIRSLREDYMKPAHRAQIPRNLKLVGERLANNPRLAEIGTSRERSELPRFQNLFQSGELLPPVVFFHALELGASETLNGRQMPFDADVLVLRDALVAAYKPLIAKIRQLMSKEIEDIPPGLVANFGRAWMSFESSWLRNREAHAVDALQPLAKAILALEPLLLSVNKERLLPWPRVQHQKVVTLKCLEGFVHCLGDLCGSVLPSLRRELDHDPRLLLLMDHVLKLQGPGANAYNCLEGVSATPEVSFPDQKVKGAGVLSKSSSAPLGGGGSLTRSASSPGLQKGMTLDAYAFRLLGASAGDAVAAGKLPWGIEHAPEAYKGRRPTQAPKSSDLHRKAESHGAELLGAFEAVKDVLLSLKSTLEYVDPALDQDEKFVGHLQRFERAFRRTKRQFLEPDNLA